MFEKPQFNPDGSFDIYFGSNAPAGKENHWVKTIPGKGWFTFVRMYGPEQPVFDGSYKLPDIEALKFFDDTYKFPTINKVKDFSRYSK
jgi:hypothetical protein